MTRAEIVATLRALERRQAESLTIRHLVVAPDGTVARVITKTVWLPREKKK